MSAYRGTTGSDRRAVKMTRLTHSRHQLRVASSPSNTLAADLVRDQVAVEVGPKLLEILRGVVPSATIIALLAL